MRVRERSGSPVRKKCSNQVRRSCFQAFTRAARLPPLAAEPAAGGAGATAAAFGFGARVGAVDGAPGIATDIPGIPGIVGTAGATADPTTGRGVKSTFMKGEIIPIVAPLESAKPKMRSDVTMRRKR